MIAAKKTFRSGTFSTPTPDYTQNHPTPLLRMSAVRRAICTLIQALQVLLQCGRSRSASRSGLTRFSTPTLVPGELSQNMSLCLVGKAAEVGWSFELHITSLAPSKRRRPVDLLHDPKTARFYGFCSSLFKNSPSHV